MTGRELRELRESWGMSQADFAKLFGYHTQSISEMEREKKKINVSLVKHIHRESQLRKIQEILDSS